MHLSNWTTDHPNWVRNTTLLNIYMKLQHKQQTLLLPRYFGTVLSVPQMYLWNSVKYFHTILFNVINCFFNFRVNQNRPLTHFIMLLLCNMTRYIVDGIFKNCFTFSCFVLRKNVLTTINSTKIRKSPYLGKIYT